MPGGGGIKLDYTRPIHLDSLAADFPTLTIIGAHPSWPWEQEMIAILQHKPNVYNDLSGWSPKYIPQALLTEAAGRLNAKFLFGSDYPFIPPDRWLATLRSSMGGRRGPPEPPLAQTGRSCWLTHRSRRCASASARFTTDVTTGVC